MTKTETSNPLRFSRPTVGRQHYVVRGALGHPNLVDRRKADDKFRSLLGEIPVSLVVQNFIESLKPGQQIRWESVRDYLGGLLKEDALAIDVEAVVAFWGAVEVELKNRSTETAR